MVRIGPPSLRCSTRGTQFARTDTLENREAESAPPAWKRFERRMRVADDHPPHKQGSSKLLSPAKVEKAPIRVFGGVERNYRWDALANYAHPDVRWFQRIDPHP